MQLNEIRSYARSLIDEVNETAVLTNTEMNRFINRRYHEVCNEITKVFEDFFGTTTTRSTIADQQAYDLPQDSNSRSEVKQIKRVEIAYDGSNWNIAHRMDLSEKIDTESQKTAYSTYVPYYWLWGNTINFLPIPTSTKTNNIKIWYIQRQSDLSADSDIPEFPDEFHWILTYGAAADAKRKEGDAADYILIQDLENQYRVGIKHLIQSISPRIIQEPQYVKDIEDQPARINEDWVNPGSLS